MQMALSLLQSLCKGLRKGLSEHGEDQNHDL